jgi:hypothetical protein
MKDRPAAYIPNEFTFVYLLSDRKSHFIAMNRLSPTEGLLEKNRKKPERQWPYSRTEALLTAFWFKYYNKVYIIAKENNDSRIYEFSADFNNSKTNFRLIVSSKTGQTFISIRFIDNKIFFTESYN